MRAYIKTGTISGVGAAATSSNRQGAGVLPPAKGTARMFAGLVALTVTALAVVVTWLGRPR
jgi:hypothetical protein